MLASHLFSRNSLDVVFPRNLPCGRRGECQFFLRRQLPLCHQSPNHFVFLAHLVHVKKGVGLQLHACSCHLDFFDSVLRHPLCHFFPLMITVRVQELHGWKPITSRISPDLIQHPNYSFRVGLPCPWGSCLDPVSLSVTVFGLILLPPPATNHFPQRLEEIACGSLWYYAKDSMDVGRGPCISHLWCLAWDATHSGSWAYI